MPIDADLNSDKNLSAELRWQAFRYVSGEMTAGEEADFEDLLATEQTARDAVTDTVRLNAALVDACRDKVRVPQPIPRPRRTRNWSVVAACVTAAFLCGWLGQDWLSSTSSRTVITSEDESSSAGGSDSVEDRERLMALYTDAETVHGEADEEAEAVPLDIEFAELDEFQDDETQVPSWLMAAVRADSMPAELQPEVSNN